MTLQLTFLGTASMVPTKERNVQSILLEYNGELSLFDCGEGTQRQMNIAGVSRAKVKKIFLTHWHGDHVGGLISLVQTMGNSEYKGTLHVYGPKGSKERFDHLLASVDFENPIEIVVHELNPAPGELLAAYEGEEYSVHCAPMRHGTPTLAYAFEEKDRRRVDMALANKKYGLKTGPLAGKLKRGESVEFKGQKITPDDVCYTVPGRKIVFIPDTTLNDSIPLLAEGADVMVCEATYTSEYEVKASEYKHLTAAQASLFAQQAGVSRLVLTHFSQRFTDVSGHVAEAEVHHPNVTAAFDFYRVTVEAKSPPEKERKE